jgi:hypothetical protein
MGVEFSLIWEYHNHLNRFRRQEACYSLNPNGSEVDVDVAATSCFKPVFNI